MTLTLSRDYFSARPFRGLLNIDLKLIFLANLVGSFGDGLYSYIMPYYMKESLGASPVEIGILYATTNVFAASTLLAAGLLGDRFDRKKILVLGWLAWVPAPLIFAFATDWVQMLPGMALWGVFLGPPVSAAYIITAVKPERVTLAIAAVTSAFPLGYIFSPALGGFLSGILSTQFVFFLAFAFYVLATIILLFVRSQFPLTIEQEKEQGTKGSSKRAFLRSRRLLLFSTFFALVMFSIFVFRPFIPAFLSDIYGFGSFEIGVLGSFSFFGSAVLAIGLGRVGDKFKKSYGLSGALILVALSLALLMLVGDFRILLVVHLFFGASYLSWPLMSAIIGPQAPASARAFSVAIPLTVGMFTSTFAPYIGGILYEVSPYYPFILAITASILLAIFAFTKIE